MRIRYYAITDPIGTKIDTSYNIRDGDRIETVSDYREANPAELTSFAVHAATKWLPSINHLQLFISLESALEYAEESKIYKKEIYPSGSSYWAVSPWYQKAIVEVFIDASKLKEIKEAKITAKYDNGSQGASGWVPGDLSKPKDPTKQYVIHTLSNKPQDYMINQVWIKDLKPVQLYQTVPETYQNFFSKSNIWRSVNDIFHDYHSPRLFSFHWGRHHKKLAQEITAFIASGASIKKLYDYLFSVRQNLMENTATLNQDGSFMRRLNYALKQLRDHASDDLDAAPKSERQASFFENRPISTLSKTRSG